MNQKSDTNISLKKNNLENSDNVNSSSIEQCAVVDENLSVKNQIMEVLSNFFRWILNTQKNSRKIAASLTK